jgi:hypothetical protein
VAEPAALARRRTLRWPAELALVVCAGLYVVLPDRLVVGPRWLLPVLIILPLGPLAWHRRRTSELSALARRTTIALVALINAANVVSMVLLVHHLLVAHVVQGRDLVYSAVSVWFTNVIVYGLWFWEIDRGGPALRATAAEGPPDIQFPQMENPQLAPPGWTPGFVDYLYTAFANGTSFAPADALPLSARAKALFAAESMVSLVTIAVVAARAVNILR